MSSASWVDVSFLASEVGFVGTMIVNSFLVYLLLNHSKQIFGTYKLLVSSFSVMGMIFASAEFVVKPMTHNYNASFTFFTMARPFECSREAAMVALAAYSSTYAATISLLAVQFVYRYWAIFNTHRISYFSGARIVLWIGVAMMFGIDWSASVYFLGMPDAFSEQYLSAEISEHYDLSISRLAYFAAVVYDSEGHIRWRSVMVMVMVSKVVTIQYAVMIYCGTRMHLKMAERMERFSITNRRMHQQLFKTLVVQITVPTFTIFMPVMAMFVVPFFDLRIGIPTGVILCSLSLYPFVDGIIVICMVSDCRKATFEIFRKVIKFVSCKRVTFEPPVKYDVSTSIVESVIGRPNRVADSSRFTISSF